MLFCQRFGEIWGDRAVAVSVPRQPDLPLSCPVPSSNLALDRSSFTRPCFTRPDLVRPNFTPPSEHFPALRNSSPSQRSAQRLFLFVLFHRLSSLAARLALLIGPSFVLEAYRITTQDLELVLRALRHLLVLCHLF